MTARSLATIAFAVSLVSSVTGSSGPQDVFVDASAPSGGDGKSPRRAYRTIAEAAASVNERNDNQDYIIRIAAGTYTEAPDTIKITREGVKLLGSTTLLLDGTGVPTGLHQNAATIRPALPPGTTIIPAGSALIRVNASHVEIAGLVLDGGAPTPEPGPPGRGLLLFVDGVPVARQLEDIVIRNNVVINTVSAVQLRLSSATMESNFFGHSTNGASAFAGFENMAYPELEGRLVVRKNRFVGHQNIALNVLGSPGFVSAFGGPSVIHALIEGNDFLRNSNGPDYPQPVQYTALNFNPMNDMSDTTQPSHIYADVRDNRFVENGYGISVAQRVRSDQNQAAYRFEGELRGNFYCGNGLNDAFFNFGLNSQSHGVVGMPGVFFRYGTSSVYSIDATADALTGFDYDHPITDPRLPTSAPGTLVLANLLTFNGAIVPPAVQITRPPLINPGHGIFGPIDVGLTPGLTLVGPNPLVIEKNANFVDPGVIAVDPCEGNLNHRVVTAGTVDVTTPGAYVLTYEVTNEVGKSATVERTVKVAPKKPR